MKKRMDTYKKTIIIDYIRIKLGRYGKNDNNNLRFDWDVQDSETFENNKKIIDIFDDYYNNKKIVCHSHKGSARFIILKKEDYNPILWVILNSKRGYDIWNYEDVLKRHTKFEKFIDGDFNGFSTSDIIYELIKMCNEK